MVDYGKYECIKVEKDNKLATVTLNRPDDFNAIDAQLHDELVHIWLDLAEDEDVNAILLTAAGSVFCGGPDFKGLGLIDNWGTEEGKRFTRLIPSAGRRLIERMLDVEQPIVAAVNGDAMTLLGNIALLSDVIVMSENARIRDTHVACGLVAGDSGAVIWPLLIGPARAKEFLMRGMAITGTEAQKMGLVNYAVPQDQVLTKAREIARELADGPTWAIRWSKLAVNKWLKQQANLILDCSLAYEMITIATEDCREGMQAFMEKRKPKFIGK
jgi:enoyl-CoA hydratase/carnithine racemase